MLRVVSSLGILQKMLLGTFLAPVFWRTTVRISAGSVARSEPASIVYDHGQLLQTLGSEVHGSISKTPQQRSV